VLAVLEHGHRARAELLRAEHLAEGRGGESRRQHEPHMSVAHHGDVDRHDLPVPYAIEEVRDSGAARLDGLLEGRDIRRRRQRGAKRYRRVHQHLPVRLEEQDARKSLAPHHALALLVERREATGVQRLRLAECRERGSGRLELLVDGAGHRARRLAHSALGDGELEASILPADERGEAEEGHEGGTHQGR
jgi:hypothetical protein